jgi:thioredoxin reductase (NADPH)
MGETRDVVILGSGCAGLTAAIYAGRANLRPLVLAGRMPGGLLTTTTVVENYPGFPEGVDGFDLMAGMQKQAERFGAEVRFGEVEKLDLSRRPFALGTEDGEVLAKTLIVATGAGHRHLGLESERALENKGVTYCATCDGALPMFRDKPLVVVGGGDSAMEEAMYLTRFGSRVFVVHRRDELRASKIMGDRAKANPKIEFVWNSVVTDVLGVGEGRVTGVRLKDVKSGAGRDVACAGVFVAIGHVPNTAFLGGQLETDADGYIVLKGGARTGVEGVFAAGDVADRAYRQAITAAGMGCAAAIEAERYLAAQG